MSKKPTYEELEQFQNDLERLVKERTSELVKINAQLKIEINESKGSEAALKYSKSEWEKTFNAISDWVSIIDLEFRVIRTNRSVEGLLNLPCEKVIGQKCFKLVHGTDEYYPDCPIPVMFRSHKRESAEIELPDGRWVMVTADPLHNEDSELVGAVHIVRDITTQKRMEEERRESEESYRQIFKSITDGLAIIDFEGKFFDVNPALCKMYGYEREELIGTPVISLIHPNYHHIFAKFSQQVKENGFYIGETVDIRKDESTFHVEARGGIIRIKGKSYLLGIIRDITLKKRMMEEKEKLQSQLTQATKMEAIATLAGGVAHQFNNVLSIITTNLDLIMIDYPDDENLANYIKQMNKSAQRMVILTTQLLGYARGGKYRPETISLGDFIEDTLPVIEHIIKSSIDVETDFSPDIPKVEADSTQMQLVLSNILSNASEAIEGKGRIVIAVRNAVITDEHLKGFLGLKAGSYVLLTIEDNGKGMDEETKSRIFEPFYTTKFQGRGLGMAATYGIIKNHDGWIGIESEPGKGTKVSIFLPAKETQTQESQESKTALLKGVGTILLVEDEEMVLDVTKKMLNTLGYTVLEAKTGREAIEISRNFEGYIDIAFLDIMLPDMNAKALYPQIMKARPDMKVIVTTGYSIESPARDIISAGAQGFLQKPFTLKKLTAILSEISDKK